MTASYILPIRLLSSDPIEELSRYLGRLEGLEIIVVDGSSHELFLKLDRAIGPFTRHVRPQAPGTNGKARGVITGIAFSSHQKIIVADDDVRYDPSSVREILRRLDDAAVVRPQNFFLPAPWHAVLDTARSLINRAFDGDWPGTLAFRKSALPLGYNSDVLFENYELVRTVKARGGSEAVARDLFIARRPPTVQHFLSQRVRQAYDEFARPWRLLAGLAVVPTVAAGWYIAGSIVPVAFAALTMGCAAVGWIRDGGMRYFSPLSVFAAPIWVLERGICCWLALWARLCFGGIRYGGTVIAAAASRQCELEKWAS